jgi:hypothetical protein
VPLLITLTKPRSNRIDALQKQIKWIKDHSHGNPKADANIKELKAELAELLEEEDEADSVMCLPCIAAKLLVLGLYVQSVMMRSIRTLLQRPSLRPFTSQVLHCKNEGSVESA